MAWNKAKRLRAAEVIARCQLLDSNINTRTPVSRNVDIDAFVKKYHKKHQKFILNKYCALIDEIRIKNNILILKSLDGMEI